MKKLLLLIVLLNYSFFVRGMQVIKLFMKRELGLSYDCMPVAKVSTLKKSPFDDIPLGVQNKIVKNMFLLTLYDNKCKYDCTCDIHATCSLCSMHERYRDGSSLCKDFRLKSFDAEKVEKHILSNVAVRYGLQYIKEFLDIVHQHNTPILGRTFDLTTIYSIPFALREKVLEPQSQWLFFNGYTQEEYKKFKKLPVLEGIELRVLPKNNKLALWTKFYKGTVYCTFGGFGLTIVQIIVSKAMGSPNIHWIPMSIMIVGGGTCIANAFLLKKCRERNPKSWRPKKVTL